MKLHDFCFPDDLEIYFREHEFMRVPRWQNDAMRLARAMSDNVSGTCREMIHIEDILSFTPNYGLTTMAVLRGVKVLRSFRHIGMSKYDGKLAWIVLNPTFFAMMDCIRSAADEPTVA